MVDARKVKSLRERPDLASPTSTAGWRTSRRYFGLWKEWTCSPSQISPAICAMYGLTAAM